MTTRVDVIVPTVGRDSLAMLLDALGAAAGPLPGRVLLVDDRHDRSAPLLKAGPPGRLADRLLLVAGRAAGPAAARNLGWRRAAAPWVAFLDDDVVPDPSWLADLDADLAGLPREVAGSQGRLRVPLPTGRRPTDWERNVHGLEAARFATADLAYRRDVLAEVGGFDERFPRAYREDADLALRVLRSGYRIQQGRRSASHPVRRADRLVSVRLQAGNTDDVLMRALHGPAWRVAAGVTRGRRHRHLATVAAGLAAVAGIALGRHCETPPTGGVRGLPMGKGGLWARVAALAGAGWLAGTAELAWARIAPGPRTLDEVATMVVTSLLLPPAATWHWLDGWRRLPALLADTARAPRSDRARPAAELYDRGLLLGAEEAGRPTAFPAGRAR